MSARVRGRTVVIAFVMCAALALGSCSSGSTTGSESSTTTAPARAAKGNKSGVVKAGFEYAATPKAPVGPDSPQSNKCYAIRAFRYLAAMPESGKFFKDKLAAKPTEADDRLQALRHQLESATPEVAADLAALADDAHTRLHQETPGSGLTMRGSPPDNHLISYLTTNCASETASG